MKFAFKSAPARTRNGRLPWLAIPGLIFILALILSEPPARAQEQESVISDVEKRIEQINRQISELRSRLKEEEKRESSLLSSLEKIRLNKKVL
ncbi:MAG: hypothetical protein NUW07_10650, partial [Candidatus Saccharicenans sp.]|nr:hypothetical protein [Candidatus Saccharicenans sp.]